MSFLILVYIAILIFLTLSRYSHIYKVLLAIIFLFGFTTIVLIRGISDFATVPTIFVFGKELGRGVFFILMSMWYGVDIFCSILVLRNYRLYVQVNKR